MEPRPSDVWRWVAAIVVAAMLAGAPGYINVVRAPTREDVEKIRDRQQEVLQRLAVVEAELSDADANAVELRALLLELRHDLEAHIINDQEMRP